ncbi:MAG: class I SAM-dependent methyltransferase [Luteimonas sp.]
MSEAVATATQEDYDAWADYYDLTEGDRSAIVSYYRSLVVPGVDSLLDLGCGTGIITAAMVQQLECPRSPKPNDRVVGIDSSIQMLARAQSRAPDISWRQGDMRQPPVDGRFDLVTCCYNTLLLLPCENDVLQTMTTVRGLLAPQGRFAFDLFQPNLPRLRIPKHDRLLHAYVDSAGRRVELREDAAFDEDKQLLTLDWRLMDASAGRQLGNIRYLLRQHSHASIRRMLDAAGLRIVELSGDYDRSAFDAASMRQVLVCAEA